MGCGPGGCSEGWWGVIERRETLADNAGFVVRIVTLVDKTPEKNGVSANAILQELKGLSPAELKHTTLYALGYMGFGEPPIRRFKITTNLSAAGTSGNRMSGSTISAE